MRGCNRGARAGAIILDSAVLLYALPASAVNWILLQGTEPTTAPAYRLFGSIGIEYQQTDGSRIAAGPFKGQPMVENDHLDILCLANGEHQFRAKSKQPILMSEH